MIDSNKAQSEHHANAHGLCFLLAFFSVGCYRPVNRILLPVVSL